MNFINTYFNAKFGVTGRLINLVGYAWNEKMWLKVVATTLQILFCVVWGTLILPFDIGFAIIAWYKIPGYREMFEFIAESTALS